MNDSTIQLIRKIKALRKEKGLSQVELAKRCHVPQSTIGRIETCSMNPSIDLVINILEVLNLEFNIKDKNEIIKKAIATIKNSGAISKPQPTGPASYSLTTHRHMSPRQPRELRPRRPTRPLSFVRPAR